MSDPAVPTVAGVCGSLRDRSYTRIALELALEEAEEVGAKTDLIDLRELELDVFDPDVEEYQAETDLMNRLRGADAIILATPMYHGSYSSAIKNAIDHCGFDEFEHKTIGLLGVSGGSFPINALEHLRSVCRALDAWVLPYQAAVPNSHENFDQDTLTDEDLRARVTALGDRIVRFSIIQEIDPASFESLENIGGDR